MNSKNEKIILNIDDVLNTYNSKKHGEKALYKYKQWFPLEASSRLAGIAADLMGDGHLQDKPKLRLDYTSKHVEELERFNKEIFYLFGIKGTVRDCKTNKYNTKNLGINNKPLVRTLKLIGIPTGSKVLTRFPIPLWILNDKIMFSRFINRLISCEGTVDTKYKFIEIKMNKSLDLIDDGIEFFMSIKNNLDKYFGINTTNPFLEGRVNLRKDGIKTKAIRLKIKRKDSLIKFYKYINIEDKDKGIKLSNVIKSFNQ